MAPSPTLRRLLKETAELSATAPNPNASFHAAPVSDSDLYEWHFTMLGPPAPSPYANGLYHGRITLPTQYPNKPPNFRFLTPSGRFETNRDICLSISGFHEETWMPAWGVRLALTALRTFMAEKGTAGQVGGLEASKEVRERLALESRRWKCSKCGGKTNQEIMDKWWAACREQGVNVEEHTALETLPEGMQKLEARDHNARDTEPGKQIEASEVQAPVAATQQQKSPSRGESIKSPLLTISPSAPASSSLEIPPSTNTPLARPESPTLTAPTEQPAATERSTPAEANSVDTASHHLQPTQAQHQSAVREAPLAPQPPAPAPQERDAMSLDMAIGAIVFLLAAMILKKVFYPAQSPMEEYFMND